ncbi:MAG: hypothetical protein SVU32_02185, partial [Candidatus Nanohaloarchaea archaeon]|nr:hypothetical protein [Candidatus Nanohaloarchaea archaeon]
TDQYSRVADVQAKIINGAGTVVDTLPMPRFTEATYNDTFVPTSTTTQNYTVNLTVQDRLQHTDFNASTEFMLDTVTPNSSAYRFNISA